MNNRWRAGWVPTNGREASAVFACGKTIPGLLSDSDDYSDRRTRRKKITKPNDIAQQISNEVRGHSMFIKSIKVDDETAPTATQPQFEFGKIERSSGAQPTYLPAQKFTKVLPDTDCVSGSQEN